MTGRGRPRASWEAEVLGLLGRLTAAEAGAYLEYLRGVANKRPLGTAPAKA